MAFSFKLAEDFVAGYKDKKVPWGYQDAGGNSVGEITFLRTYSRLKADGTKETWVDVCERVINGMYSIQKDWCKTSRLPWNDSKGQASAKEAFDRLFNLKWTPPGRGLWVMGTPIVNEQHNSAALQNCSFVSTASMTKLDPAKPFAFLMEASMLGVGVGFDDKGADKDFTIYEPKDEETYVIPDTREGWVDSTSALINSYLKPEQSKLTFDYSQIRPAGAPIKTFGGTAAGPEPLMRLHNLISVIFANRAGSKLTRVDIADIGNLIGVCVVSGNVRRSAELLLGRLDDKDFLNLKNPEVYPQRNSRHDSLEDFKRTLKFAFLYAKTVTLIPTHWEETNAIMQRNRRIGTSISGIANFADRVGLPVLREWMESGYSTVQYYDHVYSEWFGIRESIKLTTVKPSGTVSILAGESPGVHWTPGGQYFLRSIRFANEDPMLPLFRFANYRVEPASESAKTTSVVFFPVESSASRSEKDVSIYEKVSLAAMAQRHWSDNSVSVTVSFNKDKEKDAVGTVLHMFDGQLKTVSFLPMGNETYPQMPYTQITKDEYEKYKYELLPIDFTDVYAGMAADAIGEKYCSTDFCEIPK